MPLLENCKTRIVKCKSGKYMEDPFIRNIKKTFERKSKEINSNGKGKEVKVIEDTKYNKKFVKEVFSITGFADENKWMR